MQIVVKTSKERAEDAAHLIAKSVTGTLGTRCADPVVSKVFPGQTTGNRARLYMVHLPDELSEKEVSRVVERLRSQDAVESAEIPSPKNPMGA